MRGEGFVISSSSPINSIPSSSPDSEISRAPARSPFAQFKGILKEKVSSSSLLISI